LLIFQSTAATANAQKVIVVITGAIRAGGGGVGI
jgi:hypothetical protein